MSRENSVMKTTAIMMLALILPLTFGLTVSPSHSNAKEAPLKMVVLGDSLVAGYGLGPGDAFPEKLQIAAENSGLQLTIENAGVSGDTTTGGLARLDWSISENTDIVLVELGANDALRGISPAVTRKNLDAILTRLKERNIKPLLAGMLAPPNMGVDYENEFNAIYSELAKKHDVPLYPFFLDGVAAEKSLNQADGIHPTAEGVDVIVENFLPFFKQALTQATQSTQSN